MPGCHRSNARARHYYSMAEAWRLCAVRHTDIYNVDRLHYSTLRCTLNHRHTGRSPLTVTRVPERVCGQ